MIIEVDLGAAVILTGISEICQWWVRWNTTNTKLRRTGM
jgi:hypothetical protein